MYILNKKKKYCIKTIITPNFNINIYEIDIFFFFVVMSRYKKMEIMYYLINKCFFKECLS